MGTNLAKYGRSEKKSSEEEEEEVDDSQTTAINSSSTKMEDREYRHHHCGHFPGKCLSVSFCLFVLLEARRVKGKEKKEFVPDLFMTQEERR